MMPSSPDPFQNIFVGPSSNFSQTHHHHRCVSFRFVPNGVLRVVPTANPPLPFLLSNSANIPPPPLSLPPTMAWHFFIDQCSHPSHPFTSILPLPFFYLPPSSLLPFSSILPSSFPSSSLLPLPILTLPFFLLPPSSLIPLHSSPPLIPLYSLPFVLPSSLLPHSTHGEVKNPSLLPHFTIQTLFTSSHFWWMAVNPPPPASIQPIGRKSPLAGRQCLCWEAQMFLAKRRGRRRWGMSREKKFARSEGRHGGRSAKSEYFTEKSFRMKLKEKLQNKI